MMQREVHRNPELFNRHLHIDLFKLITVNNPAAGVTSVPAGTIFCNDGLLLSATPYTNLVRPGTCFFQCEDGYKNANYAGWDGCETRDPLVGIDFMPEWRRWPADDEETGDFFHENNCLYWSGIEDGIVDTLQIQAPILFENDYDDYCSGVPQLPKKK
jgi:hypothetical protein